MRLARLAVLAAAWPAWAAAVEWDGTPIPVRLAVGAEQLVRFEGPASVGVPADLLESGAFSAQFANDTAYWRAETSFGARRFAARLEATGEFVLFDVSAEYGAPAGAPIEVAVARPEDAGAAPAETGAEDPRAGLVGLVRFVARTEIGPDRLAGPGEGVVGVDVPAMDVTSLYRQPAGGGVRLTADRQWAGGGLYVTAVEAVNTAKRAVTLDARRLWHRADGRRNGVSEGFLAVAWVRWRLGAAGEADSATRVYLVTRRPFESVVAP